MLPFPALSPWAERAVQGVSVGDQQGKGKQFDQGALESGTWRIGLVGFFSLHQCQVDFIFREVMILKGKEG